MDRPSRIDFPGLDKFIRSQERAYKKLGIKTDDDSEVRHPVLAGFALPFNVPILHDNKIKMFSPGAFAQSLEKEKTVNLQLDHNGSLVMASSGLEIKETDRGLLFRIDLRRVANASFVSRLIETGNRACVSIAYCAGKNQTKTFGGQQVMVIDSAILEELSLVREGAFSSAFAFLTNDSLNPSITDMERSDMYVTAAACHRVKIATRKMQSHYADLTARVDRLCEAAPPARRLSLATHCPIVDPCPHLHTAH